MYGKSVPYARYIGPQSQIDSQNTALTSEAGGARTGLIQLFPSLRRCELEFDTYIVMYHQGTGKNTIIIIIIINSNLSNDRSKASSKTIPPHNAI